MRLVRLEFAAHGDIDALALGGGFPGQVHVEVDVAYGAVAEFLMDQRLPALDRRSAGQRSGRIGQTLACCGQPEKSGKIRNAVLRCVPQAPEAERMAA